ncbi:MAG TPA: hypothetical protein VIJ36_03555, partial [Thermoanaerobaculia bacterium]
MRKNPVAAYKWIDWAVLQVCLWALALGLAAVPASAQGGCLPAATHLCLHGRFQVEVDWMLPGG